MKKKTTRTYKVNSEIENELQETFTRIFESKMFSRLTPLGICLQFNIAMLLHVDTLAYSAGYQQREHDEVMESLNAIAVDAVSKLLPGEKESPSPGA